MDEAPLKCVDCGKVRDDVRLRIGRGARLLCAACFTRPKEKP